MNSLIIGIAGGTGSGKTTFTNRLEKEFGERICVLHHDNYYRAQDELTMQERRRTNYDHPDQLESELLARHLNELKKGRAIKSPVYDFAAHTRSKEERLVKPAPVIVVEGILIFANQELCNMFDIKIFVEADADERILRRAARDIKERGRDIDGIIEQYLTSVKPMHEKFVEPTRRLADIVINGGKNDIAFDLIKRKIEQALEER
jgi:uridine kinase